MTQVLEMPEVICTVHLKLALDNDEIVAARRLRRAVFCEEQQLFDGDDTDEIDAHALPLVAILALPGSPDRVVGTVRIHRYGPGAWVGSRLAVARDARQIGMIGSGLVQLAVGTARARGCTTFQAHVQSQNVALFERLHWHSLAQLEVHGRPHHLMQAELAHYPPIADPARGFVLSRSAA